MRFSDLLYLLFLFILDFALGICIFYYIGIGACRYFLFCYFLFIWSHAHISNSFIKGITEFKKAFSWSAMLQWCNFFLFTRLSTNAHGISGKWMVSLSLFAWMAAALVLTCSSFAFQWQSKQWYTNRAVFWKHVQALLLYNLNTVLLTQ